MLRCFVARSSRVGAVLAVTETLVGAVDRLRVGAPEVAVADAVFGLQARVHVVALREQMTATLGSQNFEFLLHVIVLIDGG